MSTVADEPVQPTVEAKEAEGRTLGRSLTLLTISRLLQQVGSFVFGVLMRGLLGPTKTGVWNYVEAWRQQLASLTAGLHYAADREMPVLRSQDRYAEENEMRWVTFTWTILEALLLAIAFSIYWLIDRDNLSSDVALGLALVPILATLSSVVSAYEGFIVNRKHFELRAWMNIGMFFLDWSLLIYVLVGGLTALLWGLVVTWTLRLLIYAGVVRRLRVFTVRFTMKMRLIRPMLRFGLPISIWNVGFTLIQRVDALVIGAALGTRQLGFYFLGPQIAASLSSIPNTLSVISYPILMETFGQHGMERLKTHIKQYHQAMLIIAPLAAAVGVFVVELIVEEFLTDFAPGLDAMKVVIAAVVFTQTSHLSLQVLLAAKRIQLLMSLTFGALMALGGVLAAGAIAGLTIEWVAAAAFAGQAAFAVLSLAGSARLAGVTRAEALNFWGRLPLAWIAFIALIFAVDISMPEISGLVGGGATFAAKLSAFAVLGLVALVILDRGAIRALRTLMATRGRPVSG